MKEDFGWVEGVQGLLQETGDLCCWFQHVRCWSKCPCCGLCVPFLSSVRLGDPNLQRSIVRQDSSVLQAVREFFLFSDPSSFLIESRLRLLLVSWLWECLVTIMPLRFFYLSFVFMISLKTYGWEFKRIFLFLALFPFSVLALCHPALLLIFAQWRFPPIQCEQCWLNFQDYSYPSVELFHRGSLLSKMLPYEIFTLVPDYGFQRPIIRLPVYLWVTLAPATSVVGAWCVGDPLTVSDSFINALGVSFLCFRHI